MARFQVVNSSPGTYWIHDTVGDSRWKNGMGLTFGGQTAADVANAANNEAVANQVCLILNLLAPGAGETLARHESVDDFVNRAGMQIKFQSGPIAEHGENGVLVEDLIEVAIGRIRVLNNKLACRENSLAITKLEEGLLWLNKRTADRRKQGVEGTGATHQ